MNEWKGYKKTIISGPAKLQLYNLNTDPKELNDLADEHPEIVEKIELIMKSAHTKASLEKFNIPVLDQH